MATKKKTKKTVKKLKLNLKPGFAKNLILVLLVGSVSFLLAKRYKGQFIAATVNYQPISRFNLNKSLTEKYGEVVLDELINQALVQDLIKKNGVEVTDTDIEEEVANLKLQLGGDEVFEATLAQYGLNLDQLKERLQVTIGQRKLASVMFSPEVTDEEVLEYYTQNEASLEGRPLSEIQEDIKASLLDQKLQQEFSTWFAEQREAATIRSFI